MTLAVYPGTFDPVTLGHRDVIERAARLFDRLVVAVLENPIQTTLFTAEERTTLLQETVQDLANVQVERFEGLVVDYARELGAKAIVRGLRMNTDFEYEFEMALMNRRLAPDVDVVCLTTSLDYLYVRSSLLKEVARLGGDITGLAPNKVIGALREKYSS